MISRSLFSFLAGCLLFAFGTPQLQAAVKVTENDFKTYLNREYAKALCEARKTSARKDKEKLALADSELAKAWKDSGWTPERYTEVDDALGEVLSNLRGEKQGDIAAEDLATFLADYDSDTVATVRAHYDELNTSNPRGRAEKQVREEFERERMGETPTESQLQGTWVFDCDATIEWMMPGMDAAERAKLKEEMTARMGVPVYVFGPDHTIEVRTKGPDGSEKVEKAVYRLEGHKVYFKGADSRREHDLQVGLRKGKLQMGMGFGMSVFAKQ